MTNIDRIRNRLSMLIEALIAKPHDRVQMAVDDCLVEDIDDKERNYLYGYARKQAKRFGYEEYLPKSGSKEADPILAPALIYITQVFTSFVKAGLKEQPDLLDIMRPKKNGKGLILYTEESLINTMVASCNLWHTNAYKNKYWDGSVESMPNITIPTTEEADSKE